MPEIDTNTEENTDTNTNEDANTNTVYANVQIHTDQAQPTIQDAKKTQIQMYKQVTFKRQSKMQGNTKIK